MMDISSSLANAASEIVQRIQRSLVVLHNGRHGIGAGIVWQRAGSQGSYVVTNFHVIADRKGGQHGRPIHGRPIHGQRIRAALEDGSELPVQIIASDPDIDLALLKIETGAQHLAMIADSHNLRVGQLVMAVGHPWGQRGAVTAGLISGISKAHVQGKEDTVDVIRSDVRLAPGNSGGPLINAAGAVVGINTMIIGGDQGIAIPSHVIAQFVEGAVNPAAVKPADEASG